MPTTPTYPGVYIEEIPSGVRTITGVSTSVTAFVGYTRNGPINKAEEILSFADFERKFGGLTKDSPLSYAVQHFFNNGGQQAYVVRLAKEAKQAAVTLNRFDGQGPALEIKAREPSARANGMVIKVDYDTAHPDSTFNLRIEDPGTGRAEEYLGLTMSSKSSHNVGRAINNTSRLIEVESTVALGAVTSKLGVSQSGEEVNINVIDETHRRFMITLDEEDGPKPVEIYNGSPGNRPTSWDDQDPNSLPSKITAAVKAIDPGREPYKTFSASASTGILMLTSGETGDGSFVRVTSASDLDAARVLRLGVANGGREIDAAAGIRPAPVGTTSGNLQQLPTFSSDREVSVTIDGDGPHTVTAFRSATDTPPEDLKALRSLMHERLREVKPNKMGSMAFMGIESEVVGDTIRILSGAEDNNSVIRFENLRVRKPLNSVSFASATHGLAVGEDGIILKTTDGGAEWSVMNPPQNAAATPPATLRGVFFVPNSSQAWAVGAGGTILATTNGGDDWATQDSGVSEHLHGVLFVDEDNGWAVGDGGTILATTNGGDDWAPQEPPPGVSANLNGVLFVDEDNGWAVGAGGTILATTNGGDDWAPQEPPPGVSANLNGVLFVDEDNGWAVGVGGTILATTNGGDDWATQDSGVSEHLHGVLFVDEDNGWAVGVGGTILATTNGGDDWATQDSGVSEHLHGVLFVDEDNGWAVGDGGTILSFEDGAAAVWSVQQAFTDTSASKLKLTASTGSENVKAYTLGVGKPFGAQGGAIPGQDGQPPQPADFRGSEDKKSGIHALLDVDIFNILCLPGVTDFELNDALSVLSEAVPFCERRRAFCIIDCPASWTTFDEAIDQIRDFDSVRSKNAAMYFPRVEMPDPLDDNRLRTFPPSGIIAGVYARTDATRGVWKAPAGQEASLTGVRSLAYKLTDREHGLLNPLGLNCLRAFPIVGSVNWGARTLHGADVLASEWKYIPVRRLALYLEESLYRGTQWVVFEPNDEPLWAQIRLNVGAFMHNLFRQGAFQGTTPRDAYFVKCDGETTTQNDIDRGIVNILVGFKPLKPAEFVIIKIQQMAGQIQM